LIPSVTGTPTSYTVSPPLPSGFSISATNGFITGTPTTRAALQTYTITASNAAGAATFTLSLTVEAALSLSFEPAGGGVLALTGPTTVATSGILAFGQADLDADGVSEIVVGMGTYPPNAAQPAPLRILAKGSGPTLVDATERFMGPTYPSFTHPRRILFADFNGDSKLDLYVAAHGYDGDPFPGEPNGLLLSQSNGKLLNSSANIPSENDFTHSAAVGDVNRDGFVDVYVGNMNGQAMVEPYLLLNNGTGVFTKDSTRLPFPLLSINSDVHPGSQFADLDGDARLDLVVGCNAYSDSPTRVLFGTAGGGFSERTGYLIPTTPYANDSICLQYLALDVNGDSKTDLVGAVTQNDPFYVGGALQVLLSGANGLIDDTAARVSTGVRQTGPWIDNIATADFNGDDRQDLYAAVVLTLGGVAPGTVDFIWTNEGSGVYRAHSSSLLPVNEFPHFSAAIDMNGDQRADLVRISQQSGGLSYRVYLSRP
jgi:hypothetical protein